MTTITIEGVVEHITFHNEENGWTIARIVASDDSPHTIVGNTTGLQPGSSISVTGIQAHHPQYGPQIKIESFETTLPKNTIGIEKFLGSGLIYGVGPKTAEKIVTKFGVNVFEILEENPDRIFEVPGVGKEKGRAIVESMVEQKVVAEIMIFLRGHSVGPGTAIKIYKQYGSRTVEIVRRNPYCISQIHGVGFSLCDDIAKALGIASDSPFRIAAGFTHLLNDARSKGHCFLPCEVLENQACDLLDIYPVRTRPVLKKMIEEELIISTGEGQNLNDSSSIYLPNLYRAEQSVSKSVNRLCAENDKEKLAARLAIENSEQLEEAVDRNQLNEQQAAAARSAFVNQLTILTGGPGTGKTTTLKTIIEFAKEMDLSVTLCAPTGKAAQQLQKATGHAAATIHRTLEYGMEGFAKDENSPLTTHLVVCDETSMLDISLASALLKAVRTGSNLILVGDVDQLPSVGPGNVLKDMIEAVDARGKNAQVVRLTQIYRQKANSLITVNAHRINDGVMLSKDKGHFSRRLPEEGIDRSEISNGYDFFLFGTGEPEVGANLIVDIVANRLNEKTGIPSKDIQVLAPMKRGPIGVESLNVRLQNTLNPAKPNAAKLPFGFRINDRVIHTKNNYDLGVFNGDSGVIRDANLEDKIMTVQFPDRQVHYPFEDVGQLSLSYALTIHKSQGSEYPVVVVPIMTAHYIMLKRNLIYTAVTRAKEMVVLVGNQKAIALAITNLSDSIRNTRLKTLITFQDDFVS